MDSKNNLKADDNLSDSDLVTPRQMLMIQRGRAFTFPDIPPRARTVSETAEEIDQVRHKQIISVVALCTIFTILLTL